MPAKAIQRPMKLQPLSPLIQYDAKFIKTGALFILSVSIFVKSNTILGVKLKRRSSA